MSEWSVYIVRCNRDSLYTGIATDVRRRIAEHESGSIGAKYLRGRGPLQLVMEHQVGDRSLASKVEYKIKRLSRADKENLASDADAVRQIISDCE